MHPYKKGDHILVEQCDEQGNTAGWQEVVILRVGPQATWYGLPLPSGEASGRIQGVMLNEALITHAQIRRVRRG